MPKYIDVERERNIEYTVSVVGLGMFVLILGIGVASDRNQIAKMNKIKEVYTQNLNKSQELDNDSILDSVAVYKDSYKIYIGQPDGIYKRLDDYLLEKEGRLDSTYQAIEAKVRSMR